MSNESVKLHTTSNNGLTLTLNYYDGPKIKVFFEVSCLIQERVTFNHGKIVNIYIVCKIIRIANINGNRDTNLAIENASFGAASLTENADVDKDKYSGYGFSFDKRESFSFPGAGCGQNVIIFGADMNSSPHIDNKGKDILY